MRAAILLVPMAAFAAWSAGAPPVDRYGDNAMADSDTMNAVAAADAAIQDAVNAAEAAASAVENDVMMSENEVYAMDIYTNAMAGPSWIGEASWTYGSQAEGGAVWYFDATFDRTKRPLRVRLRTDETPDSARTTNNIERLAEVDCAGRRYRILRTVHRDDAGRATEADERGDGQMVPIAPGSVFAGVADQVCGYVGEEMSASNVMNAM